MVESEPPGATATTDTPAYEEPRAVTGAYHLGAYLWVGGLAGVTATSLLNSALLFWLSFAVFALGGVLQGVVALWRREHEPIPPEPDHGRLGP
ncbi:MAG: hypothetical protein ACXVFM_12640 [Solirubrobacteraceae bacterium]